MSNKAINQPPIAVLMSVYEGDEINQFESAIQSILDQSYKNIDIYLMIDGQIDPKFHQLIEKHKKSSDRKIYTYQNHQCKGLAKSLNSLIDEAIKSRNEYQYFARMDSDDISELNRIEIQVRHMQFNHVHVVGSACVEFNDEGLSNIVKKPNTHIELIDHLLYRSPFIHPTVMFSRNVFTDGNRYPTNTVLAEDIAFWMNLFQKGYRFGNIEEVLLKYRKTDKTLKRRKNASRILSEIKLRYKFAKSIQKLNIKSITIIATKIAILTSPINLRKMISQLIDNNKKTIGENYKENEFQTMALKEPHKLKYAVITPTFPPENSGLGNVAYRYAQELKKQGKIVEVITNETKLKKQTNEISKIDGIKIHRFKITGSFSLLNPVRGEVLKYIKFLKNARYDVIIVHATQNWASDFAYMYINHGTIIYFSHCVSTTDKIYGNFTKSFYRTISWLPFRIIKYHLLNKAHGAIFLGEKFTGPRCRDKNILRHKPFIILPNPPSSISTRTASLETKKFDFEFLCVGAFDYMKGQDRVLKALNNIQSRKNIRVTFCGQVENNFANFLSKKIADLPSNVVVEFQYGKNDQTLWDYYSRSDLFLYGSRTECYPLVIADCTVFDLPYIAFDSGYINEIPRGIAISTTAEMTRLIDEFIENPIKFKAKLTKLGKIPTWEKNTSRLIEFCDNV